MLTFKNPYQNNDDVVHGIQITKETLKLRASIVDEIIAQTLDENIDVKMLLKVLDSMDVNAVASAKIESAIKQGEIVTQARAIIREILMSHNSTVEVLDGKVETAIDPDPNLLPDTQLLEGETTLGVDSLEIDSFLPDDD